MMKLKKNIYIIYEIFKLYFCFIFEIINYSHEKIRVNKDKMYLLFENFLNFHTKKKKKIVVNLKLSFC